MPKIEEDGKSWLRRPKLYTGVVEPYKKKKKVFVSLLRCVWIKIKLLGYRLTHVAMFE